MESGRPLNLLNQQLNHYLSHMQSEVGRSGRSLHQVFSDYVGLKQAHEELAKALEEVEIEGADSLSPEQVQELRAQLAVLQELQNKVLHKTLTLKDHPWKIFAHPDLQNEEYDLLLRTLRFVSIQLTKFWVEVQSFPLFLNILNHASVQEVENIFRWMQTGPAWNTMVHLPRLIPTLVQPSSRKVLLEFSRDVKCVHALQQKMSEKQNVECIHSKNMNHNKTLLVEAVELVKSHKLENSVRADLLKSISKIQDKLSRIRRVQDFFDTLSAQTGFPQIQDLAESRHVFQALDYIQKIPEHVFGWRQPRVLGSGQMVRIKAWQDRAKPIVETRKRLESHFKLNAKVTTDQLRDLAVMLTTGGMFRSFKSPYRDATEMYRKLLREELASRKKLSETSLQMTEKLTEWASYIEQVQAFESNVEAKTTFGPLFKGVDTDFNHACDTNAWGAQIRTELGTSEFGEAIVEYIFKASERQLKAFVAYFEQNQSAGVKELVDEMEFREEQNFKNLVEEEQTRLQDFESLRNKIDHLGLKDYAAFRSLSDLQSMSDEILFLLSRMDSNADLKAWLKSEYQASETDLSLIDQAILYIQFIEKAEIPDALKAIFLSVYGPQRYGENRAMVSGALSSLQSVKDHLLKLDAVTHGRTHSLIHGPIPELLNRIQQACRQPQLLDTWVEYLRKEREAKSLGLTVVLDHFEKRAISGENYCTAFELVWNASLLKKAIAQSGQPGIESQMQEALMH